MTGTKVAIFGLGRSGLAIGKAALSHGGLPHVFDEKLEEQLPKPELAEEARKAGIQLTLGWTGDFSESIPDLLVVNPAIPTDHPKLLKALAAGVEVVSEIEFAYRISPAPILAITGTNGKSTTTVMTYLVLKACGVDAILCGNIFGSGYPEMPLTDAAATATSDQILVAEVSSFQLDWVSKFKPVSAGITNITPDHLDRYPSFEAYASAKQHIFAAQGQNDFAVIGSNDPVVKEPTQASGPTVLKFPLSSAFADPEVDHIQLLGRAIPISELAIDEPHNLANATMAGLLAYGALRATGRVSEVEIPDGIVEGLKQFKGIAHRMERVGERNGVRVINNSMCTNPDAVLKSIQSVRRRTHVLVGGINKGLDFAPLRSYLAGTDHAVYLYGTDRDSLESELGGAVGKFETLVEAFDAAAAKAVSGEVVMLAPGCASMDQFRDFRHRGDVFRERAQQWLAV